jgi:hypothetical protein
LQTVNEDKVQAQQKIKELNKLLQNKEESAHEKQLEF